MLKSALQIAKKDLIIEFRTKQMINSMIIFSLLVLLIFNFAFYDFEVFDSSFSFIASSILWITFIFAGMLCLGRSFAIEKDTKTIDGLLLCSEKNAIYIGKVLFNLTIIFFVEIISIFIFMFLFKFDNLSKLSALIPIFILGTIGFVIVGTLLSAIAVNSKFGEFLLPIILFPILIPLIVSSITATIKILQNDYDIWNEVKLLISYIAIFLTVALMTFEYVVED